jgi:hypothetical protein
VRAVVTRTTPLETCRSRRCRRCSQRRITLLASRALPAPLFCLYTRQGIGIICGEDQKNEQPDMFTRFIAFLVAAFFLYILIANPVAAANGVKAVFGGLAIVFRSILVFFQSLAGG